MTSEDIKHQLIIITRAEARFNKSLRPRKPEGSSLGRTAQDVHLDSHTAPELWMRFYTSE